MGGGDPEDALSPSWPHPGPKIRVTVTQTAPRDVRFSDVSNVNRGFKTKGTVSEFSVGAKRSAKDGIGRNKLCV